jgi:acetoacetyl-CoA synthetase
MTDAVNGRPVRNISALANPESLDAVRGHAMLVTRHPSVAADAPADPADVVSILRSLWHDMFGALPTGTDDFFDLGGSSLMAVRLFTDIRRLTGLDLPVSLLLRASTFRQLSAALTEAPRSEQPQVVLMRPGIEGHPFFMIHSMAGRVLELWALQRALQTRRPVYGIQARGLEPGQDPQSCIFEMAQDYIKLMRSVQPAGPYSVGGFSFGGLVAFEIARQLAQRGETVERVVLIDTLVHARFMPWKHWLRYRVARPRQDLRNLLRVPPGQRMNYAWQKVNVLLDRWRISRGQMARRPDLVGSVGEDAHLPPELRRVRGGMLIATRRYKPGRFDGRVILIRPEQRSAFDTEPVWQKATKGRVEVRVAPGDHLTMITEPHVQMLARELDRCLR